MSDKVQSKFEIQYSMAWKQNWLSFEFIGLATKRHWMDTEFYHWNQINGCTVNTVFGQEPGKIYGIGAFIVI